MNGFCRGKSGIRCHNVIWEE
ncbi:MAG: hypothetical protein E6Q24_19605 [Chitinophagaceae bacterium]|nr:MAG: hypothetical protein E6Q24_19605 [Chitinophagaceae bacterium]